MNRLFLVLASLFFGVLNTVLFYHQQWGINIILFEVPLLTVFVICNKKLLKSTPAKLILLGTVLSMVNIVVTHTLFATAIHCVFFIALAGFTLEAIRNPFYLFFSTVEKLGVLLISPFNERASTQKQIKPVYILRVSIIPLLIIVLFILLYSIAVPRFGNMMTDFFEFLAALNIDKLWLFIVGSFVSLFVLFILKSNTFSKIDKESQNYIQRTRKELKNKFLRLGLKKEFLSGLITLVGLNALIFVINIMDLSTYWFSYSRPSYERMQALVHDGTGLLIFCVLLSILIALYLFRNNLNFYSKNKWLQYLAIAWLIQNMLLVFSVAWRNYWYILDFNLAYKRIGVFIFLLATLFGVITTIIKINRKKTLYYLMKVNSSFILLVLLLVSFVQWDSVIVKYNLSHKNNAYIHKNFLATLNNTTLPMLLQQQELFNKHIITEYEPEYKNFFNSYTDTTTYNQVFKQRAEQFVYEYEQRHWLSFNWADYNTYKDLKVTAPKN